MRRASQRVPLSELIWVIVLTKENLWEFVKKESVLERPVEVFGELEMLRLLEQFFDRAIYYSSAGYEMAVAKDGLKETGPAIEKRITRRPAMSWENRVREKGADSR